MSADDLGGGLSALLRLPAEVASLRATIIELRGGLSVRRQAATFIPTNVAAKRLDVPAPMAMARAPRRNEGAGEKK